MGKTYYRAKAVASSQTFGNRTRTDAHTTALIDLAKELNVEADMVKAMEAQLDAAELALQINSNNAIIR